MPNFEETVIKNFSGLSTETKPTIAAGNAIPNGSRWRDLDTAKVYHFDLNTDTWYQSNPQIDAATHAAIGITYEHHEIHSASHFYIEGYADLGLAGTLFVKMVTPNIGAWSHFLWEIGSSGILTTTLDEKATGGMTGGAVTTIHANNRNVSCWTGTHTGGNGEATVLTDATKALTINALAGLQVFNTTDGSSGVILSNTVNTVTVAALAGGTDNDWDTNDKYEINKSRMVITPGVTACTGYNQRISNIKFGSKSAGGTFTRGDETVLRQNTVYCRSFTSAVASNVINFRASWYEHTDKL